MNGSLIILPEGFEEIEAITPIDLLRRANVRLTIASLTHPIQVIGRSRVELLADGALDAYVNNPYDCVILPGGPGHVNYLNSPILEKFLKSQKGFIAAICAAPVALHKFGMLKGKRFTCHPGEREKLTEALDQAVVVDGKLITASGPGAAFEFGLAIVEVLEGADAARKLSAETGWKAAERNR
jgi:4-methyl-5(b-hydroxyethyl)-thiazole monophosphate biosynthesis